MSNVITLTLNRDAVAKPALLSMRRASEIVAFSLNNIELSDLSVSPRRHGTSTMNLNFGDEPEGYDRKSDFVDWVLERGFRDLANGVRASLEEAYVYIDVAANTPKIASYGELEHRLEQMRKMANKLNFVQLLETVNCGLTEFMAFGEEFRSLQKVRNCLEHRQGLVAAKDVDHVNGMRLALPRLKLFFVSEGEEVEITKGHFFGAETKIYIRRDTRERFFPLGSRVTFTPEEFDEIALASCLFASDLAAKLPSMPHN